MIKFLNIAIIATLFFTACDNAEPNQPNVTEKNVAALQKSGIAFEEGSWSDALAKAKKENKLIFLDISASWCGPCKQLKKTTFTDANVGKYFNKRFINVELDGEVGDGIALVEKYRLQGYPTLYFINSDGNVVSQTTGFLPPAEFLKFGESIPE